MALKKKHALVIVAFQLQIQIDYPMFRIYCFVKGAVK